MNLATVQPLLSDLLGSVDLAETKLSYYFSFPVLSTGAIVKLLIAIFVINMVLHLYNKFIQISCIHSCTNL